MNAAGERPVWSGSYEGELSNVLALQNQVAVAVADEIHVTLTQADRARTSSAPRLNLAAYDAYLKGRRLSRSSVEEIQRGIRLFQQALGIDPRYALAYAGLAESYITFSGMYLRPREAMPRAKAAAQRALELDPDLAEAHFALGVVQGWYEFAWDPAQREFRRALEFSPNNAFAHLWYGQSLISTGHAQQGISEMRIAHDLDPVVLLCRNRPGCRCISSPANTNRRFGSCVVSRMPMPGFAEGHTWLGLAYLYTKQLEIAVGELERARQLDPQQPQPIAYLAYAHAKLGSHEQSELLLRQLTDLSKSDTYRAYLFAIVSMGMNRSDAIGWLEKAYEEHDDMLSWLGVDAIFEPLRADSRFSRLIKLVGPRSG